MGRGCGRFVGPRLGRQVGEGKVFWTLSLERKAFKMTRKRKSYDRQFKIAAAQVALSGDTTVKELSEGPGTKDSTLRR